MTRRLFIKDLTNLDFAWICPQQGVLGESLLVSAYLEGELDERGFIMDFGPCKKWLRELIDEHLDHRCALPLDSKHLNLKMEDHLKTHLTFSWSEGALDYECPNQAVAKVPCSEITLSVLEKYLEDIAHSQLPPRVKSVKLELREDPSFKSEANYRYTHGLKLHGGNCQRLFHGHRNPLVVELDGKRSTEMEEYLSSYYDRVHFVPTNSLAPDQDLLAFGLRDLNSEEMLKISYQAPQGTFKCTLPLKDCILLEEEPSIENIAKLSWHILKDRFGISESQSLLVHCFEGLSKGCIFGN